MHRILKFPYMGFIHYGCVMTKQDERRKNMTMFKKVISVALLAVMIIACLPSGIEASAYGVYVDNTTWYRSEVPKVSIKLTKDGAVKVTIQKTKNAEGFHVVCLDGIGTRYKGYNTLWKSALNGYMEPAGRLLADVQRDGSKKRTVTIKNLAPGTYTIAVNGYSMCRGKYYDKELGKDVVYDIEQRYGDFSKATTVTIPDFGTDGLGYKDSYDFSALNEKDTFFFGSYEQDANFLNGSEPLEWTVLSKNKSEMLVRSTKLIDQLPYDNFGGEVTWETCTLRKWLNKNFYDIAFNSAEKKLIKTTKIKNQDHPDKPGKGGNDTKDKVFLLSYDEISNPDFFEEYWSRCISSTEYTKYMGPVAKSGDTDYWLRTVGEANGRAMKVYTYGNIYTNGLSVSANDNAILPAMTIKLK